MRTCITCVLMVICLLQVSGQVQAQGSLTDLVINPDCEAACWIGLEPGVSTDADVVAQLDAMEISYTKGPFGYDLTVYDVTGNYTHPAVRSNLIGVYTTEDNLIVQVEIVLADNIPIDDVLRQFGSPDAIREHGGSKRLLYFDEGLSFGVIEAQQDYVFSLYIVSPENIRNFSDNNPSWNEFGGCDTDVQLCDVMTATPVPSTATPAPTATLDPTPVVTARSYLLSQSSDRAMFYYELINDGDTILDSIRVRVYFVPDLIYTASEYTLRLSSDSTASSVVSGPFSPGLFSNPFFGMSPSYYFEIDYGNLALAPGESWQADVRLILSTSEVGFNATNDWWYTGITTTLSETSYLPVYVNGSRVTGQEPTQ